LNNLSYHQVRDQPSPVNGPHNPCVGDVHVRYRVIKDDLDIALLEASRHILAEVFWVRVIEEQPLVMDNSNPFRLRESKQEI
jgi:hypothetical protein